MSYARYRRPPPQLPTPSPPTTRKRARSSETDREHIHARVTHDGTQRRTRRTQAEGTVRMDGGLVHRPAARNGDTVRQAGATAAVWGQGETKQSSRISGTSLTASLLALRSPRPRVFSWPIRTENAHVAHAELTTRRRRQGCVLKRKTGIGPMWYRPRLPRLRASKRYGGMDSDAPEVAHSKHVARPSPTPPQPPIARPASHSGRKSGNDSNVQWEMCIHPWKPSRWVPGFPQALRRSRIASARTRVLDVHHHGQRDRLIACPPPTPRPSVHAPPARRVARTGVN
ncbi:hypothetical protein JB92DRAFT_2826972 [Gautieria morchelliformis]|nr:hypothetical protein JB92DRAFT_2826972 [Gautieria morchelliformis]